MLRTLDLFSGIGGFSLGLERTGGFKTVAFCEIDPFCRKVLAKHWPGVPIHDDIRSLSDATGERCRQGRSRRIVERGEDGQRARTIYDGPIDVVCGGFPCQDISTAGRGDGITGARSGLWAEMCRVIGEVRPRYAIVENVSALRSGFTRHERWPDRCVCGWAYRWRRVPVYREAFQELLSQIGCRDGGQGVAAAEGFAEEIRGQPEPASKANGTLGRRAPLGTDGQTADWSSPRMPAAPSAEGGTVSADPGDDAGDGEDDPPVDFRMQPQGAERDARGRLVCPACGRQVAESPAESYRSYWFHRVLGDLASLGFDAEWHCIPASAVGAPHRRDRVWIVAHDAQRRRGVQCNQMAVSRRPWAARGRGCAVDDPNSPPMQRQAQERGEPNRDHAGTGRLADTDIEPMVGPAIAWRECNQWLTEPDVGRVAHGVPMRVDRLRSLGNAVVPQVVEIIGRAVLAADAKFFAPLHPASQPAIGETFNYEGTGGLQCPR